MRNNVSPVMNLTLLVFIGDITLKHKLDRETRDFYMLPVMAQDAGGRTKVTSVYVVVEDINDHAPEFIATGKFTFTYIGCTYGYFMHITRNTKFTCIHSSI